MKPITMEGTIAYRDISVVVQGPIIGTSDDAPDMQHTRLCLESIRRVLPGATIILSTWEGSNADGLDYDVLVKSEDPGDSRSVCMSSSCFRQIVSSRNGLRRVKTKYAIKTRSNSVLRSDSSLRYFIEFNRLPSDPAYRILGQRVVMKSSLNPARGIRWPFCANDWFHFGLTEDVLNIFDIPLGAPTWLPKSGTARGIFTNEQYIWLSFIGKYRKILFEQLDDISHDIVAESERFFANNCIFLEGRRLGVNSLKYPRSIWRLSSWAGEYTFNEYEKILNRYAGCRLQTVGNPIEKIGVAIFRLRYLLRDKTPKLYYFFANFSAKWKKMRAEHNPNEPKNRLQ